MAPARPYWKGYLKLSLVSCPIALYPAISAAEKVSFRQVNRRTGNRLRHQLVDSVTGDVVDAFDKSRGYEVGENRFVLVEEEELEAARAAPPVAPNAPGDLMPTSASSTLRKPRGRHLVDEQPEEESDEAAEPFPIRPKQENTRTIEIEHFVPRVQLDPAFFEKPYFVLPRDQVGQEAYAVIRDAMRRKDMMGIGYVVLSSRKRPIALEPLANGIRGITLRHIEEMRSPADYFSEIPELQLPPEMLQLAEHIVGTKARDFNPAFLTDHYRAALIEMLKDKRAALPLPEAPAVPSQQNVVSLMDALKRSLAAEEAKAPEQQSASRTKKPKKRVAGQREMLLPITGEGTAKEKGRQPARSAPRPRKAG